MEDPKGRQGQDGQTASYKKEMTKYLDEPCVGIAEDPLIFWKKHKDALPSIANLAMTMFGIPASSAPVEDCLASQEKFSSLEGAD